LAIFVIVLGIQLILIVSFGALLGVIGPAESEDIATFGELMRNLFIPMPDGSNWLLYAIQQFIIAGIAAFLMPVGVIGGSLLYFDLRIRKEAFDIEMRVVN